MVKDYARQETLDPLKTAGRWIGFGWSVPCSSARARRSWSLGLLRMVQTEWPGTFDGRWTAPAAVPVRALLLCILVVVAGVQPHQQEPLTKEKR